MEGPQFSTRAESRLHRQWGAAVIGMTNLQEAKLAREAEMCFATLALATDYDCWRAATADVEIGEILRILKENVAMAQKTIANVVGRLQAPRSCACACALEHAIITDRALIPAKVKRDLAPIIGKYV
jgi:5'-methylthioadenosine phosphorylase